MIEDVKRRLERGDLEGFRVTGELLELVGGVTGESRPGGEPLHWLSDPVCETLDPPFGRGRRRRPSRVDLAWSGLALRMGANMAFVDALRALNTMKAEGVFEEYAIAGAMAVVFWTEPVPTFDLDVLVLLPAPQGGLVSLEGIYRWAQSRGYPAQDEHILIEGLPTQFVPAPNTLAREAIASAIEVDYEGVLVRVVPPEYLIALYLQPQAKTAKRRERAAMLLELPSLNRALVNDILGRHGLSF